MYQYQHNSAHDMRVNSCEAQHNVGMLFEVRYDICSYFNIHGEP